MVWRLPLVSVLASLILARRFVVRGASMEPSFRHGDCLLVDRLAYRWRAPARGEVVTLRPPPGDRVYLKRIVALPGEEVRLGPQGVLVNDEALSEPYLAQESTELISTEWRLGPQDYLVLGDRRSDSRDSRRFGPVGAEQIIGPLLFRYWPPWRWGRLGT